MLSHIISLRHTSILSSHLRLGLSSGLFFRFPPAQSDVCISPHTHATCPALLIYLDLIASTFGQHCYHEAPKHAVPVFYYFLLPRHHHGPQKPVLEHPQFCLPLLCDMKYHIHTKEQEILRWSISIAKHAVTQLVEALRYKLEGRGVDSRWCHWNFSLTYSFRPHYVPGVDSASNGNEYQEYLLGVKAAGA